MQKARYFIVEIRPRVMPPIKRRTRKLLVVTMIILGLLYIGLVVYYAEIEGPKQKGNYVDGN